jgi:hypothetical protein
LKPVYFFMFKKFKYSVEAQTSGMLKTR